MNNQKKKRGPPPKESRPTPQRTIPAFVTPMAAQVVKKKLPEGKDWIYELKFDGYRALIVEDDQRVGLRSRKNKDLAGLYRGIAAAGLRLKAAAARIEDTNPRREAQGPPPMESEKFPAVRYTRRLTMREKCISPPRLDRGASQDFNRVGRCSPPLGEVHASCERPGTQPGRWCIARCGNGNEAVSEAQTEHLAFTFGNWKSRGRRRAGLARAMVGRPVPDA